MENNTVWVYRAFHLALTAAAVILMYGLYQDKVL